MMKRIGLLNLLICLQVGFLTAQTKSQIAQSEADRFEATIQQDTSRLRQLLDPDLLYIHSIGLEESIDGYIESVASGRIVYSSFTSNQPLQILHHGKLALVDGEVTVKGFYEGAPFEVDLRYTSAYRKVKKTWRLVRWQSLKVE